MYALCEGFTRQCGFWGNLKVDATLVRHHPEERLGPLRSMELKLRGLIKQLAPQAPQQSRLFENRLNVIRPRGSSRRRKRGLINAVGEISKTLFGTATQDDVNQLRGKVNEIIAGNNEFKNVLTKSVVCINELRHQQETFRGKVNELVDHIENLNDRINSMILFQSNLSQRMLLSEMSNAIENGISYIESVHSEIRHYENLFQYRRDLAIIGHLTESLIGRNQLSKILRRLGVTLSVDYLYRHCTVMVMKLEMNMLGFHFQIPILEDESYTAWHITTIPFLSEGQSRLIKPELYEVGVGLNSGRVIELEYCQNEEPILCSSPILYQNFDCLEGILSRDIRKMSNCKVIEANDHPVKVKRLSPGSLLLYSEGEVIEERCKLTPTIMQKIEPGTYVVDTYDECFIESTAGWKFKAYKTYAHLYNITDAIVYIDVDDMLPFQFDDYVTNLPLMDLNITRLAKHVYEALPDVSTLHVIRPLTYSGSIMSVIAIIISLVLGIFMMYYYGKRHCHRRNETVEIGTMCTLDQTQCKLYPSLTQCHMVNDND